MVERNKVREQRDEGGCPCYLLTRSVTRLRHVTPSCALSSQGNRIVSRIYNIYICIQSLRHRRHKAWNSVFWDVENSGQEDCRASKGEETMGQPKGITPNGDRPARGSPSAHPKRGSAKCLCVYVSWRGGDEYTGGRYHQGIAST
jgi:hypothetical protein